MTLNAQLAAVMIDFALSTLTERTQNALYGFYTTQ